MRLDLPDPPDYDAAGGPAERPSVGPTEPSLHPAPFRPGFVPRPSGGNRPLTLLDALDSARYHGAIRPLARRVDSALGREVLADRLSGHPLSVQGYGWLLPWPAAMDSLRRKASALARDLPHTLRMDVRDCYASIRPSQVEGALVKMGVHPAEAGNVALTLEAIGETGVRGLPVGPEGSAVLANAVLARVDERLHGLPFLRWVDDYFVFTADAPSAARAARRLAGAMEAVGLRVAEDKTRVGAFREVAGAGCSGVGREGLESLAT